MVVLTWKKDNGEEVVVPLTLLGSGKAKADAPAQNRQGFVRICERFKSFKLRGPNSLLFDKEGKQTPNSLHPLISAQIESRLAGSNTSTELSPKPVLTPDTEDLDDFEDDPDDRPVPPSPKRRSSVREPAVTFGSSSSSSSRS